MTPSDINGDNPRAIRRAYWRTFALRAPVFALGAAHRADWCTFALRAPVFALGAAHRAHAPRKTRMSRHPFALLVAPALFLLTSCANLQNSDRDAAPPWRQAKPPETTTKI